MLSPMKQISSNYSPTKKASKTSFLTITAHDTSKGRKSPQNRNLSSSRVVKSGRSSRQRLSRCSSRSSHAISRNSGRSSSMSKQVRKVSWQENLKEGNKKPKRRKLRRGTSSSSYESIPDSTTSSQERRDQIAKWIQIQKIEYAK